MRPLRLAALAVLLVLAAPAHGQWTRYVNVFTGTGGTGHTFPGPSLPNGLVQLGPDTRVDDSWEGCAGYHYADSLIYGFSHMHLSGTGISDYGDVMLMPTMGDTTTDRTRYRSAFRHATEEGAPGYYAVTLDASGIRVRLTATTRAGLQAYTFPRAGWANVVLDLTHRDRLLDGRVRAVGANAIEGVRRSAGWAPNQTVAFRTEFSKPWAAMHVRTGSSGTHAVVFRFRVRAGETILARTGISGTDEAGARKNLAAELPTWNFEAVRRAANRAWNDALGRIAVSGGPLRARQNFYTALYHLLLAPNTWSDVDGRYRGRDDRLHTASGYTPHTVFSLWDTFRAAHPLYTLVYPERARSFARTFLAQYDEGGRLPVWELAANETNTMIGFHAVPVLADTRAQGVTGFDADRALAAMQAAAFHDGFGQPAFNRQGFVGVEDEPESVSKTLEYAFDHAVIAGFARALGRDSLARAYGRRALGYRHVFDPATGFFRPRQNGGWLTPFDPREVNNHFTEANAWQYGFFAPHDLGGHIRLLGGPAAYAAKLDALFAAPDATTGRNQADITGLIGQYAHGNEPSHHVAYLYGYVGRGERTQRLTRTILDSLYAPTPDGLPGNEDCGQMSAWYVFTALGLYPVTPGSGQYALTGPRFDRAVVRLAGGRRLVIEANPDAGPYVQRLTMDGRPHDSLTVASAALRRGGVLRYTLGPRPGAWSRGPAAVPALDDAGFVAVPSLAASGRSFAGTTALTITGVPAGGAVRYTLDGTAPTGASPAYAGPVRLDRTTTVRARAFDAAGRASPEAVGTFVRRPHDWAVTLGATPGQMYTAGGPEALVDGLEGTTEWRIGDWMGFQGQDLVATFDLRRPTAFGAVHATFLQDARPWILFPPTVAFDVSDDGRTWREVLTAAAPVPPDSLRPQTHRFGGRLSAPVTARYLRLRAATAGALPAWHPGAGGASHLFVSEVGVD